MPASVLNLVNLPVLASTVARRGEYFLSFFLEFWTTAKNTTVTTSPSAPSLACSRDLAVFATRRVIPLPSVLSVLPISARTVKWKVFILAKLNGYHELNCDM